MSMDVAELIQDSPSVSLMQGIRYAHDHVSIFMTDKQGMIVDCNPQFLEVVEKERSEVVGRPCSSVVMGHGAGCGFVCSEACPALNMASSGCRDLRMGRMWVGRTRDQRIRMHAVTEIVVKLEPYAEDRLLHLFIPEASLKLGPYARDKAQSRTSLGLTPAQIQVARLLIKGYSTRESAEILGVQPSTLRSHVQGILVRTGARNKLEAAMALRDCQDLA